MANAKVRGTRLSRNSSLGMTLLGVITFLFVSALIGIILIVVGLVMFWFYRRNSARSQAGGQPQVGMGASS